MDDTDLAALRAEIARLQDRVALLEARLAATYGTMSWPPREQRSAFRIDYVTTPPEEKTDVPVADPAPTATHPGGGRPGERSEPQ